jgi:hypothetical protein
VVSEERVVRLAATASRLPIVDAFIHVRQAPPRHLASRRPGSDFVTNATIYAVALIATAGFVVAAVVDDVLGIDRRA